MYSTCVGLLPTRLPLPAVPAGQSLTFRIADRVNPCCRSLVFAAMQLSNVTVAPSTQPTHHRRSEPSGAVCYPPAHKATVPSLHIKLCLQPDCRGYCNLLHLSRGSRGSRGPTCQVFYPCPTMSSWQNTVKCPPLLEAPSGQWRICRMNRTALHDFISVFFFLFFFFYIVIITIITIIYCNRQYKQVFA